jgi:hypothetical protein
LFGCIGVLRGIQTFGLLAFEDQNMGIISPNLATWVAGTQGSSQVSLGIFGTLILSLLLFVIAAMAGVIYFYLWLQG